MLRTMRFLLFVRLVPAVVLASAEAQPVTPPTLTPGTPGAPTPDLPGPQLPPVPLAREEAEALRRRLKEALSRQASLAPRSSALREAGLSDESDAVEGAAAAERSGAVGPIGVGLAEARPTAPGKAVDPGLAAVTLLSLRARLDREPTAAEVEAELRAFDARVEQANRWLAANRKRVAKAYATAGAMPPSFDDEALRATPVRAPIDSLQVREAFRALFRSLLTQPDAGVPNVPPVPPVGPRVLPRPTTNPPGSLPR